MDKQREELRTEKANFDKLADDKNSLEQRKEEIEINRSKWKAQSEIAIERKSSIQARIESLKWRLKKPHHVQEI